MELKGYCPDSYFICKIAEKDDHAEEQVTQKCEVCLMVMWGAKKKIASENTGPVLADIYFHLSYTEKSSSNAIL